MTRRPLSAEEERRILEARDRKPAVDFPVELPQIEFRVPWQHYRPGDRIRPNGTLREHLVDRGLATLVPDKKSKRRGKR